MSRVNSGTAPTAVDQVLWSQRWPIHQAVPTACILEASAPKVGNVHPQAGFADVRFEHFVLSGLAAGEVFRAAAQLSVGELVLQAVEATQAAVGQNTNLGTLLLLAPLAKARLSSHTERLHADAVQRVLAELTPSDSQAIYAAIRAAKPGGMGQRPQHDIQAEPPSDILPAMASVATIDAVARQYTTCFDDLFLRLAPWFDEELQRACDVSDAICRLQLRWLAHEPDGLIVRKLGLEFGQQVQQRAHRVWRATAPHTQRTIEQHDVQQFDNFLRADSNRRNPGTTADLIAATLFLRLI